MANTKTISTACNNNYSLELRLTENSTSTANNTSSVSWSLVLISSDHSFSTYRIGWSVSLDGTVVSSWPWDGTPSNYQSLGKHSELTIASGTRTITHNTDGSKSLAVSASMTIPRGETSPASGSSGQGTFTLSGSMALTAIPRASTLTIANGTLGTAQTLTINRASSSFTHTLTYTCGTATGTIVSKTSNTSVNWTPPLSLAAQNTTGTTVSVTVKLTTFNGSTEVGSKDYSVKMTIPASVKPSVSIATSNPEGHLSKYGGYVQGKSRCQVTLSVTLGQGSAIKNYSIKVGTKLTYTTNGCLTSFLTETGTLTVQATVTDARGRTGTASTTIKVLAYSAPQITNISAIRTNSSGTAEPDSGTYAKVTFSAKVTALGNANAATYMLKYRVHGTSSYSSTTLTNYTGQYNVRNGTKIITAALANSYDCYISVTDDFTTINSVVVQAPSGEVFLRTNAAMTGLSFGQQNVSAKTLGLGWLLEANAGLRVGSDTRADSLASIFAGGYYTGDLDTLSNPGCYWVTTDTLHRPTGVNYGELLHLSHLTGTNGINAIQVVVGFRGTTEAPLEPSINVRLYTNSLWSPWRTL